MTFLQERPEPASRLDTPRSHEDAVVDHNDNPDAYEAVLPGAGSDAQAFLLAEVCRMSSEKRCFAFTSASSQQSSCLRVPAD